MMNVMQLEPRQEWRALIILMSGHMLVIASSNYLVQLPFTIMGVHFTWGVCLPAGVSDDGSDG